MSLRHIHIVSFDIPYPPDYGGVIDVFYCIQTLHRAGIAITLHCTYKGSLSHYSQLEKLCTHVYYYKRRTGYASQLQLLPYGIVSRVNNALLKNLQQDEDPIIFEGLVSCYYLSHPSLAQRNKIFRECNIEHDYYRGLAKASHSFWKSMFYRIEAWKLQRYESIIRSASSIAAVAHQDEQYFKLHYPQLPTYYIPSFHGSTTIQALEGKGKYILYHGNLQLAENENAAMYILQNIVPALPECHFIFAGRHPSLQLYEQVKNYPNVTLYDSPAPTQMEQLIQEAQIHLLPTFQATGLKLKLLNVLYNGRFVIVNPPMIHGTDLASLCQIANSTDEMIALCRQYFLRSFSRKDIQDRENILSCIYNDNANLQKLLTLL